MKQEKTSSNTQPTFAYYCRVGTQEQRDGVLPQSMPVQTQEQACMQLAKDTGLIVGTIYTEKPE